MDRPLVLVVDDDENITSFLKRALAYEGFAVDIANGGEAALKRALAIPPDIVILDVMMPGLDGLEVCRRLRAGGYIPILMLTARDAVPDKVQGLQSGADDYLVKPFAIEELVARLQALLRRQAPARPHRVRFADLTVDMGTRDVWRGERAVNLTAREFDLLAAFLTQARQVLSRDQLMEQVWGFDSEADTHVVEVYVRYCERSSRLRASRGSSTPCVARATR